MLRRLSVWVRGSALALATGAALATPALAEPKSPVVVELFTSQGCSSCPPADAFFATLAPREDVIALGLHVDYWDYIGWKDVFADTKFSRRQKAYARHAGRRSVYTPQMIIQGAEDVVGTHPMDVSELIMRYLEAPSNVTLDVERTADGRVGIEATAHKAYDAPLQVQVVRYDPTAKIDVLRGENAGRTLVYSNIVRDWQTIGEWDTRQPLDIDVDAPGDTPVVVILQQKGPGPIEAAARLH